jgi:hypothetical protein
MSFDEAILQMYSSVGNSSTTEREDAKLIVNAAEMPLTPTYTSEVQSRTVQEKE